MNTKTEKKLLDLDDLANEYGLKPDQVKRERWLRNKNKISDGFGAEVKAINLHGKIRYRRDDIEQFISSHMEHAHDH